MNNEEEVPINNSTQTLRILRTVPSENAFHFYLDLGRPTNFKARNLDEFASMLALIDPTSVVFHLGRGDFEKWFGMLGDHTLVQSVSQLKTGDHTPAESKQRLIEITTMRASRLRKVEH